MGPMARVIAVLLGMCNKSKGLLLGQRFSIAYQNPKAPAGLSILLLAVATLLRLFRSFGRRLGLAEERDELNETS